MIHAVISSKFFLKLSPVNRTFRLIEFRIIELLLYVIFYHVICEGSVVDLLCELHVGDHYPLFRFFKYVDLIIDNSNKIIN